MSQPLWKINSGDFTGWRRGDYLFDEDGVNVGYFDGDIAYSLTGNYIGELYRGDRIGKRTNIARPIRGVKATHASIAFAKYANKAGSNLAGWEDLNF